MSAVRPPPQKPVPLFPSPSSRRAVAPNWGTGFWSAQVAVFKSLSPYPQLAPPGATPPSQLPVPPVGGPASSPKSLSPCSRPQFPQSGGPQLGDRLLAGLGGLEGEDGIDKVSAPWPASTLPSRRWHWR